MQLQPFTAELAMWAVAGAEQKAFQEEEEEAETRLSDEANIMMYDYTLR